MNKLTSSRRAFILRGTCAAIGAICAPLTIHAACVAKSGAGSLTVVDFASTYSGSVQITGSSAVASLSGGTPAVVQICANVADPAALTDALAGVTQLGKVFASGNTLYITAPDGTRSELKNIIGKPAPAELAHDTVAADTTGTTRTDRVGVYDGTIKLASRPRSLVAAFDTILRGIRDAAELGLREHATFTRLKKGILRTGRVVPVTARGITSSFLRHATALADALPAAEMTALMRSPIITASLRRTAGTAPLGYAAQMASHLDPSQVLERVLGATRIIEPDAVTAAVTSGTDHFRAQRSREALTEAARRLGAR